MIAKPTWIGGNSAVAYHVESRDNYYLQEGELGVWQGKGAEALGFTGAITEQELKNALWGKNKDGEQMVNVRLDEKGDRKRAALDLVYNAPKSVSVLLEMANATGNKEFAQKIVDIFNKNVEKSMNRFETILQTRETEDKKSSTYFSGNIAIANFTHTIARPVKNEDGTSYTVDPSLHRHAVVMNMTQAKDGTWKAIETRELFDNYMNYGALFRMDLAHDLKNELGLDIEITNAKQAFFEVDLKTENNKELLDLFSKRSEQINEGDLVDELQKKYPGKDISEIKQMAAHASREWKGEIDRKKVESENLERAGEAGFTKETMQKILDDSNARLEKGIETKEVNVDELVKKALYVLEEEQSVFKKSDVLMIAGKLGFKDFVKSELINEAFDKNKDLVRVGNPKNDTFYSTKTILALERHLIDSVQDSKRVKQSFLARDAKEVVEGFSETKKEATGFGLTAGQKKAVVHVLSNTGQVIGIQGDAGSGKTTMLDALNKLKNPNTKLIGLSYTGKAANEIELKTANNSAEMFESAGIESFTIASFLNTRVGDTANLMKYKDLKIIVDEASMVGVKDAQKLVDKAQEIGAQLVFMGDSKQFKAIGAGDPFDLLKKHANMKTVSMDESIRQKDETLKRVVKHLNNKDFDGAFDLMDKKGIIQEISPKEGETGLNLDKLVEDYFAAVGSKLAVSAGAEDVLKDSVILTNVNKVKDEMNVRLRNEAKERGILKKDEKDVELNVRKSANLRPIEQFFGESYIDKKITHLVSSTDGSIYQLVSADTKNDTLKLKTKEGEEFEINLHERGREFVAYSEEKKSFGKGERIIFLKNNKKGLKVNNGEMGTILDIDDKGNMKVKIDEKKSIASFNINDYNYLDYGYAITTVKSQGLSAENVFTWMKANEQNGNSFYVATTRAINNLKIYTDDKTALKERVSEGIVKYNATTFLEQRVENSERRIEAFREKSKKSGKKDVLRARAKNVVKKYFLKIDVDKLTDDEVKLFLKNEAKTAEKQYGKMDRVDFLLGVDKKKIQKSARMMLGGELGKHFVEEKDIVKMVKIWEKIEEVDPLSKKASYAALLKIGERLGLKEFEILTKTMDALIAKDQNAAVSFSFLLAKMEKKEENLAGEINMKIKDNDKDALKTLKMNKSVMPEKDLKQINENLVNFRVKVSAEKEQREIMNRRTKEMEEGRTA